MPARPCHCPLAVRPAVGIADCLADDCVSQAAVRQPDCTPDGGGRPYGRPPLQLPGGRPVVRPDRPMSRLRARPRGCPPRPSPGCPPGRPHSGWPPPSPGRLRGHPPGRPLRGRPPTSSPRPAPPPPPPPTVLSTVGFLGEYKEGNTNTLNLLPNLCFPRALSCTLHLLLGKPLLRKSEIVLGVSFGTPNTISAAWLLHSFIPYFCPHRNGQHTMVSLVH